MTVGKLEQQVYRSTWDDGLVDLFVGLGLAVIGISWLNDAAVYGAIVPALLVPFWSAARKRITEPRAGRVTFGPARRAVEKKTLASLAVAGVMVFGFGIGVYIMVRGGEVPALLPAIVPALPSAILGCGALAIGLALGLRRFFWHAAILFVAGIEVAWRDARPGWALLVSGIVILLIGLVLLVRFLRRYPVGSVDQSP